MIWVKLMVIVDFVLTGHKQWWTQKTLKKKNHLWSWSGEMTLNTLCDAGCKFLGSPMAVVQTVLMHFFWLHSTHTKIRETNKLRLNCKKAALIKYEPRFYCIGYFSPEMVSWTYFSGLFRCVENICGQEVFPVWTYCFLYSVAIVAILNHL